MTQVFGGSPNPTKELRVSNWAGFIGSKKISGFEKRDAVSVKYETYSSNEELLEKMKEQPKTYDLIFASTFVVHKLIKSGLVRPLSRAWLPHSTTSPIDFEICPSIRETSSPCPIFGERRD